MFTHPNSGVPPTPSQVARFRQAHIDTLTPAEGREANGKCDYSISHGLKHIKKDLWGK